MSTMELQHRQGSVLIENGELLGQGHIDYGAPRSFKVSIYRGRSVVSGNTLYVVQKVGLSSVEGETDRFNCTIVRKPAAVIQVLHSLRRDKTALYMPKASMLALEQASTIEPALWRAWEAHSVKSAL